MGLLHASLSWVKLICFGGYVRAVLLADLCWSKDFSVRLQLCFCPVFFIALGGCTVAHIKISVAACGFISSHGAAVESRCFEEGFGVLTAFCVSKVLSKMT